MANLNPIQLHTVPLWKWALLLVLEVTTVVIVMSFPENVIFIDFNRWLLSALALAGAVFMLYFYRFFIRKVERHGVTDPALPPRFRALGRGFLVGVVLMSAVVGGIVLLTPSTIEVSAPSVAQMVFGLSSFFLVAVCEELLFRGVVFRFLDERWNTAVALIASGLIFGFAHAFQDNATLFSSVAISVEAGFLLGAAYKQSGTLWVPIGLHWAWNFSEGYLYGTPVSGMPAVPALFPAHLHGQEWITGGPFGPEASVVAMGGGLLVTAIYLYVYLKKRALSGFEPRGGA